MVSEPYRVLVTGSRTWEDREGITFELARLALLHPEGVTVVHGACPRGADAMADQEARKLGLSVERHRADWSQGKAAGFQRNQAMVDLGADVCLAFIREHSKGATHCARAAEKASIPVEYFRA